jgi:hypothetical protein
MIKFIHTIYRGKIIKTVFVLFLISLPFIGSDCSEDIFNNPGTGDIKGSWRLVYNAGTNHDICSGEEVTFNNNGQATLKCPPNTNTITRLYTVSNNQLTYTETGIVYDIEALTANELQLSGSGRYLYYIRTSITDNINNRINSTGNSNSSEK